MEDKSTYWMPAPNLPGYVHRLNVDGYRETRPANEVFNELQITAWSNDSKTMLSRIRQSLQARLEGRNEGGDTEVMRLVDEIVKREILDRIGTGDGHNGWYQEG